MKKLLSIAIVSALLLMSGCAQKQETVPTSESAVATNPISITEVETTQSVQNQNQDLGEIRDMYEHYIDNELSRVYFMPIDDYNGMYMGEVYDGNRQLSFIDLDNNGDEECILIVRFVSEECLPYSMVHIFDMYDGLVKRVFSTKDCGPHRAQEKFAVIKNNDGLYRVHLHITDPHAYFGNIYSYNGLEFVIEESYYCDRGLGDIYEYVHARSTTKDVLKELGIWLDNGEIDPAWEIITEEEFYNTRNQYLNSAVFTEPSRKPNY